MLHTDSAYALLSEKLEERGIMLDSDEITDKVVKATASSNGVDIHIWFDSESQQFGFDMLTGGTKKYDNLDDFIKYFKTYFAISTEVVPKAKMIADTIDEELGIQTIYDSFKGNKSNGYHVIFRVLGDNTREVQITRNKSNNDLYKAEIILYNEGKTQKKTDKEFLFNVDDEANIKELVTLDSYLVHVDDFFTAKNVKFQRLGNYEFFISFIDSSDSIHYLIELSDGNITYKVLTYNDTELDYSITLKNPYDLYSLRDMVKVNASSKEEEKEERLDTVDDMLKETGLKGLSNVDSLEVKEVEDLGNINTTGMTLADDLMTTVQEESMADVVEEDNKPVEEVTETEPEIESESDYESEQVSTPVISDDEIEIENVKLIKTEGRITGVLFSTNQGLYRVAKEVALELLPLNAIETFTKTIHAKGMCMTEEEKEQKKFAKDMSFDKDFCIKLVEALFN